jgi:hypothetical protein
MGTEKKISDSGDCEKQKHTFETNRDKIKLANCGESSGAIAQLLRIAGRCQWLIKTR